jgi:predicted nuclease of predicted toxin-antitoxin system
MSELRYRFLTDENIAPDVVGGLRQRGYDVRSAAGESLFGRDDATVLRHAHEDNRVVVTHDLAFGRSALADGAAFTGIIYLRPGHISAAFVLAPRA